MGFWNGMRQKFTSTGRIEKQFDQNHTEDPLTLVRYPSSQHSPPPQVSPAGRKFTGRNSSQEPSSTGSGTRSSSRISSHKILDNSPSPALSDKMNEEDSNNKADRQASWKNVVVQSPRARQRLNFENKSGNENTTETIKDSEPMNSSMTMHRQQSGVKAVPRQVELVEDRKSPGDPSQTLNKKEDEFDIYAKKRSKEAARRQPRISQNTVPAPKGDSMISGGTYFQQSINGNIPVDRSEKLAGLLRRTPTKILDSDSWRSQSPNSDGTITNIEDFMEGPLASNVPRQEEQYMKFGQHQNSDLGTQLANEEIRRMGVHDREYAALSPQSKALRRNRQRSQIPSQKYAQNTGYIGDMPKSRKGNKRFLTDLPPLTGRDSERKFQEIMQQQNPTLQAQKPQPSLPFSFQQSSNVLHSNSPRKDEILAAKRTTAYEPPFPTHRSRADSVEKSMGDIQYAEIRGSKKKKEKVGSRKLRSAPWEQNLLTVYDSQTINSVRADSDSQSASQQRLYASQNDANEQKNDVQRSFRRESLPHSRHYFMRDFQPPIENQLRKTLGKSNPNEAYNQNLYNSLKVGRKAGNDSQEQNEKKQLTISTTGPLGSPYVNGRSPTETSNILQRIDMDGGNFQEAGSSLSKNSGYLGGSQGWMKLSAPYSSSSEDGTYGPDNKQPLEYGTQFLESEQTSMIQPKTYQNNDTKEDSAYRRGPSFSNRSPQPEHHRDASEGELRDSKETNLFLQAKLGALEEQMLKLKQENERMREEKGEALEEINRLRNDLAVSEASNAELQGLIEEVKSNESEARSLEKNGMDELKEALEVALQDVQNLEEVAELARGELEDYKRRIPDELENARQQARAGLPSQDAELGKLKFELERANANTVRAREERDHVTSILDKREDKEAILRSELEIAQSENEKLIAKLDDLEELTEVRFELDKANSNLIDAFNERDHMKSILIGHEENEANLKSNLEAAHVQNQELHGKLDELEKLASEAIRALENEQKKQNSTNFKFLDMD